MMNPKDVVVYVSRQKDWIIEFKFYIKLQEQILI